MYTLEINKNSYFYSVFRILCFGVILLRILQQSFIFYTILILGKKSKLSTSFSFSSPPSPSCPCGDVPLPSPSFPILAQASCHCRHPFSLSPPLPCQTPPSFFLDRFNITTLCDFIYNHGHWNMSKLTAGQSTDLANEI